MLRTCSHVVGANDANMQVKSATTFLVLSNMERSRVRKKRSICETLALMIKLQSLSLLQLTDPTGRYDILDLEIWTLSASKNGMGGQDLGMPPQIDFSSCAICYRQAQNATSPPQRRLSCRVPTSCRRRRCVCCLSRDVFEISSINRVCCMQE